MIGFPIRKSADQFVYANTRSLSQLITSFFASQSQGIHHTPFIRFLYFQCLYIMYVKELSYFSVENIGVEPTTSCVQSRRSSHLS